VELVLGLVSIILLLLGTTKAGYKEPMVYCLLAWLLLVVAGSLPYLWGALTDDELAMLLVIMAPVKLAIYVAIMTSVILFRKLFKTLRRESS